MRPPTDETHRRGRARLPIALMIVAAILFFGALLVWVGALRDQRAELRDDIATLRTDMTAQQSELRAEVAEERYASRAATQDAICGLRVDVDKILRIAQREVRREQTGNPSAQHMIEFYDRARIVLADSCPIPRAARAP